MNTMTKEMHTTKRQQKHALGGGAAILFMGILLTCYCGFITLNNTTTTPNTTSSVTTITMPAAPVASPSKMMRGSRLLFLKEKSNNRDIHHQQQQQLVGIDNQEDQHYYYELLVDYNNNQQQQQQQRELQTQKRGIGGDLLTDFLNVNKKKNTKQPGTVGRPSSGVGQQSQQTQQQSNTDKQQVNSGATICTNLSRPNCRKDKRCKLNRRNGNHGCISKGFGFGFNSPNYMPGKDKQPGNGRPMVGATATPSATTATQAATTTAGNPSSGEGAEEGEEGNSGEEEEEEFGDEAIPVGQSTANPGNSNPTAPASVNNTATTTSKQATTADVHVDSSTIPTDKDNTTKATADNAPTTGNEEEVLELSSSTNSPPQLAPKKYWPHKVTGGHACSYNSDYPTMYTTLQSKPILFDLYEDCCEVYHPCVKEAVKEAEEDEGDEEVAGSGESEASGESAESEESEESAESEASEASAESEESESSGESEASEGSSSGEGTEEEEEDEWYDENERTEPAIFVPPSKPSRPATEATKPAELGTTTTAEATKPNIHPLGYEMTQDETLNKCSITPGAASKSRCDSETEFCHLTIGECMTEEDVNVHYGMCANKVSYAQYVCEKYEEKDVANTKVCGCDGTTRGSLCLAYEEGVNIAYMGECSDGGAEDVEEEPTVPEEPSEPVVEEPQGGSEEVFCVDSSTCGEDEFCAYPGGQCPINYGRRALAHEDHLPDSYYSGSGLRMPEGVCHPKPQYCGEIYQPICGCDGQNYENVCAAHRLGMNMARKGVCPPAGSMALPTDITFDPDQTKPYPPPVRPFGPSDTSRLQAAQESGTISSPEMVECTISYGHPSECPPDQYCALDIGTCNRRSATHYGTCAEIPNACSEEVMPHPVCGCDGVTYSNICEIERVGMSVSREGECDPPADDKPADNGEVVLIPFDEPMVSIGRAADEPMIPMGYMPLPDEPMIPLGEDYMPLPDERLGDIPQGGEVYGMYQGPCMEDSHCKDGLVCTIRRGPDNTGSDAEGACTCDTQTNEGCAEGQVCGSPPGAFCPPGGCLPTCTCDYSPSAKSDGSNGCATSEVCRMPCAMADAGPMCFANEEERDCDVYGSPGDGSRWICRDGNADGRIDFSDGGSGCVQLPAVAVANRERAAPLAEEKHDAHFDFEPGSNGIADDGALDIAQFDLEGMQPILLSNIVGDDCVHNRWHESTLPGNVNTCTNDIDYPTGWGAKGVFLYDTAKECCETKFPGDCTVLDVCELMSEVSTANTLPPGDDEPRQINPPQSWEDLDEWSMEPPEVTTTVGTFPALEVFPSEEATVATFPALEVFPSEEATVAPLDEVASTTDDEDCKEGFCKSPSGKCGPSVQCFVEPCSTARCMEGTHCESNMCGGCHAHCIPDDDTIFLEEQSGGQPGCAKLDRDECKKQDECRWKGRECLPQDSDTDIDADEYPGSTEECPGTLCRSPSGNCGPNVDCVMNPCAATFCASGMRCEQNTCGGCHAVCLPVEAASGESTTSTTTTYTTTTATTSTTTTTSTTEELAPLRVPLDPASTVAAEAETPVEKWYADFPNAADGVINCIFGSFYDTSSVFDTEEECCDTYPCRHEEYWYPAVYHDLRIVVCEHGSDYPEDYWQQPRTHLFKTEDDCWEIWGDTDGVLEETTDASAPTTTVAVEAEAKDESDQAKWYPDLENVVNHRVICMYGTDYPDFMNEPGPLGPHLFDTREECCDSYPCVDEKYWYLNLQTGVCEFGFGYNPDYLEQPEGHLFRTEEECLEVWDASAPTTTVAVKAKAKDESDQAKWYPDLENVVNHKVICMYGTDYPDFMNEPGPLGQHLFDTKEECCDSYPCVDEEYWYLNLQTGVCEFGVGYNLAYFKGGHLFRTEEECLEVWGEAGDSSPDTTATSTTTTSTAARVSPVEVGETHDTNPEVTTSAHSCKWHISDKDDETCTNSGDYPPIWDQIMPEFRHYYFFATAEACCHSTQFHDDCKVVDTCTDEGAAASQEEEVNSSETCQWHMHLSKPNTCTNSGLYPPVWDTNRGIGSRYKYSSSEECCESMFSGEECTVLDECSSSASATTDTDQNQRTFNKVPSVSSTGFLALELDSEVTHIPWNYGKSHPEWRRDLTTSATGGWEPSMTNIKLASPYLGNPPGAYADLTLRLIVPDKAMLSCWAKIDVSMPFEYFALIVDGEKRKSFHFPHPSGDWVEIMTGFGPGEHEIILRVQNGEVDPGFSRQSGDYGSGQVWLDDCKIVSVE